MTDILGMTHTRGVPRRLLLGASMVALASGLAMPAEAQLARLRAAAGTIAPIPSTAAPIVALRPVNMREALARQQALQGRADQIRGYVTAARDAALAATRAKPTDGLSAGGLDPIAAVKQAAALTAAGGVDNIAKAQALLAGVSSANDATGLNTWEGAGAPVQSSADGKTNVSITQTQSRALLTWNRFDVGANTTLQFDQQQGGVAQPGWTVVNRVASGIDPSTILGGIKAQGTVLVLNRNGVIFGAGAQVNLASLVASTLEVGNFGRNLRAIQVEGQPVNVFDAITLKERNTDYLQNGLFAGTQPIPTLPSLLLSPLYAAGTYETEVTPPTEGTVTVDRGAKITASTGGFVILAGPRVTNDGIISASDGQVSLQGGRLIAAVRSTGASNSADVNVRGLILRTIGTYETGVEKRSSAATALDPTPGDGVVVNTGLIESPRGYLSLGAGLFGSVANGGLLTSTTSVSRNGKIALNAGFITLAGASDPTLASGIVISPDTGTETIPQGTADQPASFKTSQIEIGARADNPNSGGDGLGIFIPSVVTIGQNALILAPSANIVIGRNGSTAFDPTQNVRTLSGITIATGAAIDVSGVKDVQLAATRNSIEITPVKRNELRDTPTYREVSLTGDFTLNGSTLFIDPRLSGVRADGVRWVGSPLIEAGSIASQIGVTAAELMTRGGNVAMGVNLVTAATPIADAPKISIAPGATIDFGGGWVHYNAGTVRTSNLLTADGRIVNIGEADPNDTFVGVADGYTQVQPRFGLSQTFGDPLLSGNRLEAAYDEGRDAGSLVIGASAISLAGTLFGEGFAGARQIGTGVRPTLAANVAGDPRLLARSSQDLPSGGFLRIGSFTGTSGIALGGDLTVVRGTAGTGVSDGATTLLSDAMLSRAGLSALSLQTSGAVSFSDGSALSLADGGALRVDTGRSITFGGLVRIASGSIAARTYELSRAPIAELSLTAIGSAFRTDDDITGLYAVGAALPHPFDVTVKSGARLSTAGRFVNDALGVAAGQNAVGGAFVDGGSITLAVAPKVLVALGDSIRSATDAGDLSGRLTVAKGASLDVSAGAYVAANRALGLTGAGGDIAFINETTYASTVLTVEPLGETAGRSDQPIAGSNQSVDFTPTDTIVPALVPTAPQATVSFDQSSLRGFGFSGGGTFTLVAPSISFGSDAVAGSAHIGLDFFAATGFGTLNATTFRSRIVPDIFTNERAGNSAFFETTSFRVKAGETLDLTQSLLPQFLTQTQAGQLLALASEDKASAGNPLFQVLTPGVPVAAFDRVAANLTLGGLTELDVLTGGKIVGAAEARVVAPKILNQGSIVLPGGSLIQREALPITLALQGLGVSSLTEVFGRADANGQFDENALNTAGVTAADGSLLTIRQLFTQPANERFVYFTGLMAQSEGIRLTAGSVTDLSGVALVNTRAGYLPNGQQVRTGRVIDGGVLSTAAFFNPPTGDQTQALFTVPRYGNVRYLNSADNALPPIVAVTSARTIDARPGATVDLSGASAVFDVQISPTSFMPMLQWSDGGTLTVGGGGSLADAQVDARGGAPRATGGTLNWVRPTIREDNGPARPSGEVSANQIEGAGFATVNALGGVTFKGEVSLTLGKAFTVTSASSSTGAPIANEAQVTVSADRTATAEVVAPFIRFASRIGSVPTLGDDLGGRGTLSFTASAGIDMVGGVLFDSSVASVTLRTPGDIRFIGVDDRIATSTNLPSLNGRVVAWGDLLFDAGRTYATTGTGNLQRFLEPSTGDDAAVVEPFLVAALGRSSITFGGTFATPTTAAPLSAGSYLRVQAASIVQNGYLAAPLGRLELGGNTAVSLAQGAPDVAATETLTFGQGSVTTVSGAGLTIPYGTTTDLTEYFFSPSVGLPLTAVPVGQLTLSGDSVYIAPGAKLDGRGGGAVFAFEFVSGTGGSRDVLDRFNRDTFSANDYDPLTGLGYQYADRRQVYAIVPADQARSIAPFDPIYSADYQTTAGSDLYGAQVGLSVTLDGGGGIPAGEYVLLPAHYALLPGAFRVVQNVGQLAPAAGSAQTLLDGSVVVGGSFSTAGTDLARSERLSFTVQSRDVFGSYSRLETTGGTQAIVAQAQAAGRVPPRIPLDAARVVLAPRTSLIVSGAFDTTPAEGGKGAQFDLLAANILVTDTGVGTAPRNTLLVSDDTLARLNANSLSIGAERSENEDGTTNLGVIAKTITIGRDVSLSAPELILSVGGNRSALTVQTGAALTATGLLDDTSTGEYVITSLAFDDPGFNTTPYDTSGVGAVLRLSSGAERLIARRGPTAIKNTARPTTLAIQAATLTGNAVAIDTSQRLILSDQANIVAPIIALSADTLRLGAPGLEAPVLTQLAAADRLTLRSRGAIQFARGSYAFNDLRLDTPGLQLSSAAGSGTVTITADAVTIGNTADDLGACAGAGGLACGTGTLRILAKQIDFAGGTTRTYGFGSGVTLGGTGGMYVDGKGSLEVGAASLTLLTPFIADRSVLADPRDQAIRPDFTFATTGTVRIADPTLSTGAASPTPVGNAAPGARIAFGRTDALVASLTIAGTDVRASSGIIDVQSKGAIALTDGATLATPGYARTFGDAVDSVTVVSGGGTVNLVSTTGDISIGTGSRLTVDTGVGEAGTLNLIASNGAVAFGDFATALNSAVTGNRAASLTFDSGKSAFDLAGFARLYGRLFGGELAVRSGTGDLALASGEALRAERVSLVADGGSVVIGGTIDTSGLSVAGLSPTAAAAVRVDGGDVSLYGARGVTLAATALIDTHTSGYLATDTRVASAGDVAIGIGNVDAAITFAAGARIDVGARRTEAAIASGGTGARLVAQTVKDPGTLTDTTVYRLAEADEGGTVAFRAPVIFGAQDTVDVRLGGTISGASEVQLEGFHRYDLDTLAASGKYSGVRVTKTGVSLNFAEGRASGDPRNILTDVFGTGTGVSVAKFIQTFAITAKDGSDLGGLRLRPGVELVSKGDISLATNWNLGAGTIDERAAFAAGLLTVVPELGTRADGSPYYAVTPGREGELLQNYVTMLYRVGGKASGEAGVVTIRARGSLDIAHDISDGFFSFADRTDPKYLSYQFGGGNRTVAPTANVACGVRGRGDCAAIQVFDKAIENGADPDRTLTISLTDLVAGSDQDSGTVAPYSAVANSAAGAGSGRRGAGDPLGGADLFPLLEDGTRAVRSTSLRLVAGADASLSADPLHVDRATAANAVVRGETSYKITVQTGRARFGGTLELKLPGGATTEDGGTSASAGDFLDAAADVLGAGNRGRNKYTVLNWGDDGAVSDTTRQRARDYFAKAFPDAVFQGAGNNSTGVAAPLAEILGFLQAYGDEYASKINSGTFPSTAPKPPRPSSPGRASTVNRGTMVRTGDGTIDLVAADTVDLRRTEAVVTRNSIGTGGSVPFDYPNPISTKYQVGGTAVYTAGHLVTRQPIVATAPDGTRVTYSWNAAVPAPTLPAENDLPSFAPRYFNAPQLIEGGGDVAIVATSGDVLGRRDVWAEQFLGDPGIRVSRIGGVPTVEAVGVPAGFIGASDQRWRVGRVGGDTEIALVPQLFSAGVGALGGGDVRVTAAGRVDDLTLALDTSVTTANPLSTTAGASGYLTGATATGASPATLVTFGHGNASVRAGEDLVGGQFDVASGVGDIRVGGDVIAAGPISRPETNVNEFRLRVSDAYVRMRVRGSATIGGLGALGVTSGDTTTQNAGLGFFSAAAGFDLVADEGIALTASRSELIANNFSDLGENSRGGVLPPTLQLASVTGDIVFSPDVPRMMYPSTQGQLSLVAGGDIASLSLAMSDADPSLLPGAFSVRYAPNSGGAGLNFGFDGVFPTTTDQQLRLFHNERTTHAADDAPARVYAGGSITDTILSLAKQARIGAGIDIVNMVFTGQNARDGDVTRITAGRDIIGTTGFSQTLRLPFIQGNTFTLGGHGSLAIEAGRNLGPFLNSATLGAGATAQSYAGGIRTVGNDLNPWLESRGANIQAFFGIANGANYDALQSVYLDPATAAELDGDLFVQISDANGNLSPDRTRPVYAPILADWLAANAPEALAAAFGGTPPTGTELAAQSYGKYAELYAAFTGLDNLTRRTFLINQLYFNELAQPGIPTGPSYQQYIRGYRATQTLFPPSLGYTDNLSSYVTDPATVTPDNPLGVPTRNVDATGNPVAAVRVVTGNVDLRLATVETVRGGDITIMGPGGTVLAGSVVRTSDQAARRSTLFGAAPIVALESGSLSRSSLARITAIPIGFEGVLSLRGGSIRSFTDGDFRLNQSRLFTLAGGDITLWSSNGDLNAGQGPRSASSFPPITVRFDQNGLAEIDSAGSVAGAGIGAFKQDPTDADANIILVAPVGEVDAGDAGVRASGNVFVAAARVANADNFSAGGSVSGVPTGGVVAGVTTPQGAASSIVGNIAKLANASANNADRLSLISVDVLGFFGGSDPCDNPNASAKDCPAKR